MLDLEALGPAVLTPPTKASRRQWKRGAQLRSASYEFVDMEAPA